MTDQLDGARRLLRIGATLTTIALIGVAGAFLLALRFTPVEATQGVAQKIFYVHVPAAWGTLIAFSLCGVASAAYLFLYEPRIDRFAASSAEVGLAFAAVMLTSGPLWGRPIWGTYWDWDPRLTLTLLLFLLFLGYGAMRSAIPEPKERARYSAVLGIMALVLVPFIHLSVYLYRTIHPKPVLLRPDGPAVPAEMLRTMLVSVTVFTLLYIGLVTMRYALALARDLREQEIGGGDA